MNRYALCIGMDNYTIMPKLKYARKDAEAVANKLLRLGFDVEKGFDLKREALNQCIATLSNKIKQYDVVLLYYAGHGCQINNTNLLLPIDFNPNDDDSIALRTGYPISEILDLLNEEINKTRIIIVDACRSTYKTRGGVQQFAPMIAPKGTIIAFATSPNETAKEENGHGLFTKYLLNHMDDSRITIETMFKRIRTDLFKETNGKQISWEHTSLIGNFQLNPICINDFGIYTMDAMAINKYTFDSGSPIVSIVNKIETGSPDSVDDALKALNNVNYNTASADEIFVLARYIYWAACWNNHYSQKLIDGINDNTKIPFIVKEHILNGMAYEIYFDRKGIRRLNFEWKYADAVLNLLETDTFLRCRYFINYMLREDPFSPIFYFPGQKDKVEVQVIVAQIDDGVAVKDIVCAKRSIYCRNCYDKGGKPSISECKKQMSKDSFETDLRKKMVVSKGCLKLEYHGYAVNNSTKLLLPLDGYTLFDTYTD